MPNDDFLPDLTKLDGDYQVLTELHGEGDSRTYLARHLRLNRDVTISVFRTAAGLTADALAQFASDTRLLAEARHPHVVPTIDGIWLDRDTFAAVRARVRGATLAQSLGASGPMSIARVASTMHDVVEAISWARDAGVSQRDVAPWDIVCQQGSGRTLLSFEPPKSGSDASRTEADDARTVRRLAIEMLAGEIDRTVSADSVVVPRSIPPDVADALAAIRHSTARNANGAVSALLNALDAAAGTSARDENTQMVPAVAPPALSGAVLNPAEREIPTIVQRSADSSSRPIPVVTSIPHRRKGVTQRGDAVVMTRPRLSFNARFGTAIVVVGAIATLSLFALNRKDPSPGAVASGASRDTTHNAGGEVALHPVTPPRPAPTLPRRIVPTTIDSTPTTVRPPPPPPLSAASRIADSISSTRRAITADSATSAKKRVVVDSAAEAERQFQRDSAADVADPCLSSEASSQRRCLSESIERNDRQLNTVYARLIAALRRQAGAASADPDPDAVISLRAEQRKWAEGRDDECREIGDEPLYAKSRGACYAQKATDRARELQQRVAAVPPAQ
jgi:uncharacterized protein YecT (DUF1311 family)